MAWYKGRKMDTSKKYIKMCERAVEIQDSWKARTGDSHCTSQGSLILFDSDHNINGWKDIGTVWLPRQDQLQEMLYSTIERGSEFVIFMQPKFNRFSGYKHTAQGSMDYPDMVASMEQLWLAFVMEEKYSKTWDGEDWV